MNRDLFLAILSMDSYNRGYGANVNLGLNSDALGRQIGSATIYDSDGDANAQGAGFYAIAYDWQGEKVIAYRGTNDPYADPAYGYPIGAGFEAVQGGMAIDFYQSVVGNGGGYSINPNVTVTGHSLGGGLAGLVAGLRH